MARYTPSAVTISPIYWRMTLYALQFFLPVILTKYSHSHEIGGGPRSLNIINETFMALVSNKNFMVEKNKVSFAKYSKFWILTGY